MTDVWLDANVVLRYLTREPPALAAAARRLIARAADGEIRLRLTHVTIAEIVWVLGCFYERRPVEIADALRGFVLADGVSIDDTDTVVDALRLMSDANVDFADAYVAVAARRAGAAVASFDADFRRLGVELLDIKG